ncbi:ankyrin-1-like [Haliotis rubra]|uniref:ankyrin-1-like n=1 Tax=Haliotis rubra TaxID=36100 RepID=UPI001EE6214B|nr:ankyrin-1-like [Haliotis rubra]
MAVARGHKDVFVVLVSEGADLSLGDTNGKNILHYACAGGHVDMIKYVLSLSKVDIDSTANAGLTPVMVAASLGNREMFDILMSKACDVSLATRSGSNILHMGCCGGHLEMVKYIISQDLVDINSRRWDKKTPLLISAKLGHGEMFEFIASRGGNMSMMTKAGKNSLHLLCKFGNIEVVKFVLSKDLLDINAKTKKGETAAMIAKRSRNTQVYDFLVSHGGQ